MSVAMVGREIAGVGPLVSPVWQAAATIGSWVAGAELVESSLAAEAGLAALGLTEPGSSGPARRPLQKRTVSPLLQPVVVVTMTASWGRMAMATPRLSTVAGRGVLHRTPAIG